MNLITRRARATRRAELTTAALVAAIQGLGNAVGSVCGTMIAWWMLNR
ncbi:hypothetical protein [Nocardia sp. NPDC050175]